MTTPNDPDQLRRDIEQTQTHLSTDVDALTEKVTPSRIVERRVERVRGTANRWKDKVMGSDPHQSGGSVSGTASAAATSVSDTASTAATSVAGAASSVADAVQEAPRVLDQQTRGNPLAAGLIAFGAGWLISSLLPATRKEQELAAQAKEQAGELGGPLVDAAKQAAVEVKDNLAEPAQEAVESVRATATDAGQTVVDEGRAAAAEVQGRGQEAAENVRQSSGQQPT